MNQQVLGKTQEALDNYWIVLRLKPGERGASNNIAWIYATHPDSRFRNGAKAVELMRPLAAAPDCDANFLDTLAAAYAETGRFDDALKYMDIAIDRARATDKTPESIADMQHGPHSTRLTNRTAISSFWARPTRPLRPPPAGKNASSRGLSKQHQPAIEAMKPESSNPPAGSSFIRGLGLLDSTMIVAGSMIGSGIFIVSADIARQVGSAGWLLAVWLVTGGLTLIGALSYGELAAMFPRAGGQYVYLREAYGPLWGFLYGWTLFLVIQTGTIAAVAVAFARSWVCWCRPFRRRLGSFRPSISRTTMPSACLRSNWPRSGWSYS